MSGPDSIDALVVARRVLARPKTFRLSTDETLAMAGCLIGLDEQLDAIEDKPVVRASLAAAIAAFIAVEAVFHQEVRSDAFASDEILHRRQRAFNTLKITFEKEFPNGEN